ncbi:hypothetical protein [Sphingobium nicotianae]|uniref:Uncharacterized protein n=1 Tax=Sphingobium nicotianae TaxID=2782607 RepID=A0A9X1DFD7_9SPHN|nr:hypothetical protein [Sphingobium nicotianae]MBT2188478.1 hypothetical protein [Sphingobium nicotianae]
MIFDPEPAECDHPWYATIRASENFPELRQWCQATFNEVAEQLDKDFPDRFRRELPQRISELFFAHAFAKVGWRPVARVPGFDFAYELGNGRLLVEVTTPSEQPADNYEVWEKDGISGGHVDDKSIDSALLRLTSGFCKKAEIAAERIEKGLVRENDYVVIAISGLQISQNTPVLLDSGVQIPDFIRAFLPVGPLVADVPIDKASSIQTTFRREFSAEIQKAEGKQPVKRSAFLDDAFAHIHGVAFTSLNAAAIEMSAEQIAVLHNPSAYWTSEVPRLGMGIEYEVAIEEGGFRIDRR